MAQITTEPAERTDAATTAEPGHITNGVAVPPRSGLAPERPAVPEVRALHPSEVDWVAFGRQYPEDDGQPMSDNTEQFWYIVSIVAGLDALFQHDPNVFVAGNLLWYPVEGQRRIRQAPDAMVVFGRPKGHRGSYAQFIEGGIAPQVVFEVLSPRNTAARMARKRAFYERYGVEEYYEYDPQRGQLRGWLRRGGHGQEGRLVPITDMRGWVSPRLGVRFELTDGELSLYGPDGRRFRTYAELEAERREAEQRAEQERQRAEQERQRAERLLTRLRALGIDPDMTGS